jgi:hypothetical protein
MKSRSDVFTLDAYAWMEANAGKPTLASRGSELALAEGTQEARLFLHAALIAARVGDADAAKNFSEKTFVLRHLLLPSERKHLQTLLVRASDAPRVAEARLTEKL